MGAKEKILYFINHILIKKGMSVSKTTDMQKRLLKLLKEKNVDLLFDIGANDGEYSLNLLKNGYKGKIVSIEPTIDAYKKLVLKKGLSKNWVIEERCALGEKEKEIFINVTKNSYSSSFLNPKYDFIEKFGVFEVVRRDKTPMYLLDKFFKKYSSYKKIFLKLDCQGYELNILKASKKLNQVLGILIEIPIKCSYEKESSFNEILEFLDKKNFSIFDIEPGFRDKDCSVIEVDAIFLNRDFII